MTVNLKCVKGKYILNDILLKLEDSLKVRNHSPTGFSHGYYGSGPSQLALAVMLKVTDETSALRLYQYFKINEIATLPVGMDFDVTIKMDKYL